MKSLQSLIIECIIESSYTFATPETGMVAFAGDVNWKGIFVDTTPQKFLDLVTPLSLNSHIRANINRLKQLMEDGKPIDPAVLIVNKGKVVGHEGRHRALAAQELDITKFPVLVIPRDFPRVPDWTDQEYQIVKSLNFIPES